MPNQPKTPVRSHRIPDEEYLPAVAKGKAEGLTSGTAVMRMLLRKYVASAGMFALVMVGAMSGTRPNEVTLFGGVCQSDAVCERNADIGPAVAAMIADQVATYGPSCVDPAKFVGIPSRVLVRNAHRKDFDTGVVRVVTLDAALAAAKAGAVYVLKACA